MKSRDLVSIVQEVTNGKAISHWNNGDSLEENILNISNKSLQHPDYLLSSESKHFNSYNELVQGLEDDELISLIDGLWAGNEDVIQFNAREWEREVASPEKLREDFRYSMKQFKLFWGKGNHNERDLLIRAIPGHAQSGHCTFRKTGRYPNTMTKDVAEAVSQIPGYKLDGFEEFSRRSQEAIDEVLHFNEKFFLFWDTQAYKFPNAINEKDKGLGNISVLKNPGYPINMLEWLKGFYFGGNFDNYDEVRKSAEEKYGFPIGGGSCHPMDINKLKKYNLSLRELAEAEYSIPLFNHMSPERLKRIFTKMGIIIEKSVDIESIPDSDLNWEAIKEQGINPQNYPGKDIRNVYMREKKGQGVMDDIAIAEAGFLPEVHGRSVQRQTMYDQISKVLAAYMADRIDTLEKDSMVIIPGGQDEIAAKYINERFKRKCMDKNFRDVYGINVKGKNGSSAYELLPHHVLRDFTMAAAMTDKQIHSSQAYFLKKQDYQHKNRSSSTCTLKEIFNAVYTNAYSKGMECQPIVSQNHKVRPNISVGFHGVPWKEVLKCFNERLNLIEDHSKRTERLYDFYNKQY